MSGVSAALALSSKALAQADAPKASPGGFDVALYKSVAAQPGNHFVSPYSARAAFSLVYPGAGGETASEIAKAFGFVSAPLEQAEQDRKVREALQSSKEGGLCEIANAAWVERTMALKPDYARTIRSVAGATIEAVDFKQNQQAALKQINDWASASTHGKIPSILDEPNPARRLVLTNAIYFKGAWAAQFSAKQTVNGEFRTRPSKKIPARLMRRVMGARYFESDTFQAAALDYRDRAFSLAVFLPRRLDGLAALKRR